MKNILTKSVGALLILIMLLSALAGCVNPEVETPTPDNGGEDKDYHPDWNFYPEGYTAGFPDRINKSAPRTEFWWVETYDECLTAIELLKSHGSTFEKTAVFTSDGELFDTKYCFTISLEHILTDPIKFGDNPFDRRAGGVKITSYAFFEEVTIEEINHSDINEYKWESIDSSVSEHSQAPVLNSESLYCRWDDYLKVFLVYDFENGNEILALPSFGYYENPDTARECLEAVYNSFVFVGFE